MSNEFAGAAFDQWREVLMQKAADMPLREALRKKVLYLCPTCREAHPGIRFIHPDHRQYCSSWCFRERER